MNETISVIIPVYHEQEHINALLADLLARNDPALEIIIVDGSENQLTLRAIRSPDNVIQAASPPGRSLQQNIGAALATGDVLLFLHADTELPPHAFDRIRIILVNQGISAGAFALGYSGSNVAMTIIAHTANLRTRLTRVPYGDQAIFVRRAVFEQLGGFAALEIMEDLEFMTRLRRCGHTISIIDTQVRTSPRRHLKEGILRCTLRNWFLRICYHAGIPPRILATLYRKHLSSSRPAQ